MPCKDTTSQITVILDDNDCLVSFDYSKLTCQKTVGGGTGFEVFCRGKSVLALTQLEFSDLVDSLELTGSEEQFLLYLEWDALEAALDQYHGSQREIDTNRYQIATIAYEGNQVEIQQLVASPEEMPKLIPCRKRVP